MDHTCGVAIVGGIDRLEIDDGRVTGVSLPGGNTVSNPRSQVITAAGEGSASGIAISSWLLEHDIATTQAGSIMDGAQ